jgi:AP-1 complex subunit beta-1
VISDDTGILDPLLLDKLLRHLATLSSIYHKPAETFVSRQRLAVQKVAELGEVG